MENPDAATTVAAAAAAAPVEGKPAEAVADAAKAAAESAPKEDATLLGEDGKKDGVTVTPEAKPVVPEKYSIKPPEGMTIDQAMLDKITPVFKELGISQEGAQKLADVYAPQINQMIEAQRKEAVDAFGKMVGEWKDQTVKELGVGHEKELAHAAKFIDKFGGPELRQVLNETGLGNHIAVVKAFIAAGKAIANDSFPDSGKKVQPLDTEESKAQALFPSTKQS
jgi:hypothetical protein